MDVKAKRLRREGYVVGNVFGREMKESIPVKMVKRDVEKLLKTDHKGSQIMLDVDGTVYDVLIKNVDYNPVAGQIDSIEFQALVSNEKVHSVAEIVLVNHEKIAEGVLQEDLNEVAYMAYPASLVDQVMVDVGEMKIGDVIRVKDLSLAARPGYHHKDQSGIHCRKSDGFPQRRSTGRRYRRSRREINRISTYKEIRRRQKPSDFFA